MTSRLLYHIHHGVVRCGCTRANRESSCGVIALVPHMDTWCSFLYTRDFNFLTSPRGTSQLRDRPPLPPTTVTLPSAPLDVQLTVFRDILPGHYLFVQKVRSEFLEYASLGSCLEEDLYPSSVVALGRIGARSRAEYDQRVTLGPGWS